MAILLWLLTIGYWLVAMAIDYIDINYMGIGYWFIGNWYWLLVMGIWLWLLIIDRVNFGLLRFGVRTSFIWVLNVWFLGFRVRVFQVWSDFRVLDFWSIIWFVLVYNIRIKNQNL